MKVNKNATISLINEVIARSLKNSPNRKGGNRQVQRSEQDENQR